jgi:hypothetical protein
MNAQGGWLRLWAVLSAVITCVFGWDALRARDLTRPDQPPQSCVPFTLVSYTDERVSGYDAPRPTNWGAGDELQKLMRELDWDRQHQVKEAYPIYSCVSYGRFFAGLLRAVVASILVATTFMTIRWVIRGFRGT